jgi:hypothetical protein
MDADEFVQRWHSLDAVRGYLLENLDIASGDEVLEFMVASAILVRDSGGDLRQYVESVCAAFPGADDAVRQELREKLWTKLSALL